jgi:hypothetical protein
MPFQLTVPLAAPSRCDRPCHARQIYVSRNDALCALIDAVASNTVRIGLCGAQVTTAVDIDRLQQSDLLQRFFFMPVSDKRRLVLFVHQCIGGEVPGESSIRCSCASTAVVDQQSCIGPLIMLDSAYVQRHAALGDLAWLRKYRRLHWLANLSRSKLRLVYRQVIGRRAALLARRQSLVATLYSALEGLHRLHSNRQRAALADFVADEPDHGSVFVRELDIQPSAHRFMIRDYLYV